MLHTKQKTNIIDLLIPLFALGLITFGIGNYGLYEPHESHFAMVGNEMVWRGDWITPYLNGAPYLNKPPFLYWLIAASTTFFGNTEFAARLPVAMSGWLGIIIAGKWSKDLWGVTANRITVLMLSVTLGWYIFSHQILTDILLSTLVLASNYFLWKLLYKPQSWLYFFCLYISIALCLLTKGFIGIFFIACSYVAIAFYHRSWSIFKKTKLLRGILFTCALVIPWFLAVEKANPGFLQYFIFNEHIARLFGQRFPPDYTVSRVNPLNYLAISALWCFPWILFFPSIIGFIWQKIKLNKHHYSSESDAIFLLIVNFVLPIIIFLPISSRLIYYSVPAIPAYIMLCAGTFNSYLDKSYRQGYFRFKNFKLNLNDGLSFYGYIVTLCGIVFTVAIAFFPKLFESFPVLQNYSTITTLIAAILLTLALGFLVSGIELLQRDYSLSFKSLIVSLFLFYSILTVVFYFYQDIRSSKNLVAIIDNNLPIDTLIVFEGSREIGTASGLTYYLNQDKTINKTKQTVNNKVDIPVGFVSGKGTKIYRNVVVLKESGENRIPPQFPGIKLNYLIDKQQLQTYWNSERPVAFVTDFLRDFNNNNDPINLNLPENVDRPLFAIGKRQVYVNQAAIKFLNRNKFRRNF